MPLDEQDSFILLVEDIKKNGPIRTTVNIIMRGMDAKELLIKLDKIANDVLRLTYEETLKAIYETTYKNAKLAEQTQKKNIQYIAELV